MTELSIVIITKNEAHILERTLQAAYKLTDDTIIVDSGSTDDTLMIAGKYTSNIIQIEWQGYGAAKNTGIENAKYDWILSLDADEIPDQELLNDILNIDPENYDIVYKAYFKNYIGDKHLRFSNYLKHFAPVIFNRTQVKWNNEPVHEKLVFPTHVKFKILRGYIQHYSMKDFADYEEKMSRYSSLNAEKYFSIGKNVSSIKLSLVRQFNFLKNYIFRGGFLDGHAGFMSAKIYADYTYKKYSHLKKLHETKDDHITNEISNSLQVLRQGGLILYPTDTIWGIGCDATNEAAIDKIYKLKQREESKSMIILVANEKDIVNYTSGVTDKILSQLENSKTPTTVIYDQAKNLPENLVNEDGSIGIRVVHDDFCNQLIRELKKPLVSTSANISGHESPRSFNDIDMKIKNGVDYIVQHRQKDISVQPSAIIRFRKDGSIEKIR